MSENRGFVVVALDDLARNSRELTEDLNRQLDAIAPGAELHFIQAIGVSAEFEIRDDAGKHGAFAPRTLVFFRHYDPRPRGRDRGEGRS